MAKKIYQTKNGIRRELSAREVKAVTMRLRGWTTEQYNKEYDKLRNRLRGYEAFRRAHGDIFETQSPAHILYHEAKARKREGEAYKPSIEMRRLMSFSSRSTSHLKKLSYKTDLSYSRTYEYYTLQQFGGLIQHNPGAKQIVEQIDDPIKREMALKHYAFLLHAKIKESGEVEAASAIPFGQAVGSDDSIDFDIQDYL